MTPADLFLSPDLSEAQAQDYLASLGFREAAAVDSQLQRMADDLVAREALGRLAPDLLHALLESPDPDAAATGVAHYVAARTGRAMFLDYLREDPRALHVLAYVMGGSPVLGEILVRTPEYFHWLVSQIERSAPDRQDHEEELVAILATIDEAGEALDVLRRWKRRELLRIGARELLKHDSVEAVAVQLSDLAAVAVEFALGIAVQRQIDAHGLTDSPGAFAVIATGRLGSVDMGYDSMLELLYVYEPGPGASPDEAHRFFAHVASDLTATLHDETHEGVLYRIRSVREPQPEMRSLPDYEQRYAVPGGIGERLSLARARHVAGDARVAARFVSCCQRFVFSPALENEDHAVATLLEQVGAEQGDELDALTLALQVAHGARHASLRDAGTTGVLTALARSKLVPDDLCRELSTLYGLLRTAEHRRQLGSRLDDLDIATSRQRLAGIRQRLLRG